MSGHVQVRLHHGYGGFSVDVDLRLPGRGVTALFGPSGSGKTTALRLIAGLERADDGFVSVNGEVWQDGSRFLPAHKRPLGYVFQEASLFPHFSVRGNLDYGRRRAKAAMDDEALESVVELLGIGHLLARMPDGLSGGERQRVAIARALAVNPRLLLMDEPLAALDLKRKHEILPYLERLHDELSIPVLYVSHSPDEVARLADHLVLMENGRALASGPCLELMNRPDLSLAQREDGESLLAATVVEHDEQDHLTRVAFTGGELWLPRHDLAPGNTVRVRIHARDVSLSLTRPSGTSILNILPATVLEFDDIDSGQSMVRLQVGGVALLARITRRSVRALALAPGQGVYAQIKSVALVE
ncbi:MAG: molybdenum ABC transporter ATP-binding protein [Gammaproteobacteria bacterium]|nr:molybdenum ABC transporter ATP-binding protein [Gammaproteobacteria bacterium]